MVNMKISSKGRYAIEAILDLAIHSMEGHQSLGNIAERTGISENYLEQIFLVLRRKGLVSSVRGAQGGYFLADDPGKISVGAVIRALEGPLAPVSCIKDSDCSCERMDICVTRLLWGKFMNSINDVADNISLYDLVQRYKREKNIDSIEYFI
jgi:Rrf2 family protein